jgi:hypothetical protein
VELDKVPKVDGVLCQGWLVSIFWWGCSVVILQPGVNWMACLLNVDLTTLTRDTVYPSPTACLRPRYTTSHPHSSFLCPLYSQLLPYVLMPAGGLSGLFRAQFSYSSLISCRFTLYLRESQGEVTG